MSGLNDLITSFCADLELRMRRIAEEVIREEGEGRKGSALSQADLVDEQTRRAISEQLLISSKTYLSRKEAAKYLGVSERSIAEWAARPPDQNPFPEAQAGGEPRAKRSAIDEWTEREKQRQRLRLAG